MTKTAVVLFNLGGPDSLKAVKPFLFNLFNDRAIIRVPQPLRSLIAFFIATVRGPKARDIYRHMGGKSPLLQETQAQAEALEKILNKKSANGEEYKVFVCMRHWHPMSEVVVKKVKAYSPDRVILLPLYPQFSTTTTGSSFTDWKKSSRKVGLDIPTTSICCYPSDRGFVAAHARIIKDMYWKASEHGKPKILFSAHGLPEKIIAEGDPYQWHIERSVASIIQILAIDEVDYGICYQSRVGRLEWLGPYTEEEISAAGKEKKPLLVVPVSFVSEHSETLVELDLDYRKLAEAKGVPGYYRVPTLSVEPYFIEALADLCLGSDKEEPVQSFTKERFCPRNFGKCACAS